MLYHMLRLHSSSKAIQPTCRTIKKGKAAILYLMMYLVCKWRSRRRRREDGNTSRQDAAGVAGAAPRLAPSLPAPAAGRAPTCSKKARCGGDIGTPLTASLHEVLELLAASCCHAWKTRSSCCSTVCSASM